MISNILFALGLALNPVMEEEIPSVEISEVVEEEQLSEEVEKSEVELDEEYYLHIIEELKNQVSKLQSYVENETIQSLIGGLIAFITTLGALYIKFKSFDKSTLTLDNSKKLLEDAKSEMIDLTKKMNKLAEEVSNSNHSNEELYNSIAKAINTLNASMTNLYNKVSELENKED